MRYVKIYSGESLDLALDKTGNLRYNKPKSNDGNKYAAPQSHREPVLVEAGTTQQQNILPEPYSELPRGK